MKTIPVSIALLMLAGACDSAEPDAGGQVQSSPAHNEVTSAEDSAAAHSPVMAVAMKGQSVEAFEASLAQVAEQATEAEYRQLENALGHLLNYDLAVKRDRTRLYARLDGRTPLQIIEKAGR